MKIRVKELGPHRWLCYCWPLDSQERSQFQAWLAAQGDRYWLARGTTVWGPEPMEVRGGSLNDRMIMLLRWGGDRGRTI